MKKFLLLFCLLILSGDIFAQQFLQYNTETVYDSFENPSQRSFIRDTTRMLAFNFFIPSFTANGTIRGNAQQTLLNRIVNNEYNNNNLQIGAGRRNPLDLKINAYLFMFKVYLNQKGDRELGFSMKLVGEGRANVTDETIALFNGGRDFAIDNYPDLFNSNGNIQVYQQYGVSYREKITPKLALGFKVNALLGVEQHRFNLTSSNLVINRAENTGYFSAQGTYDRTSRTYFGIKNPGLSVSFGGSYRYDNGIIIQSNIKDLGFIYWGGGARRIVVDGTTPITNFTSADSESNIQDKLSGLLNRGSAEEKGFFTSTNGILEASLSKRVWLDDRHRFRAFPALIVQKELFYNGLTGALTSHFQYNKLNVTLATTYNNRQMFGIGTQFMYKVPNFEFFIGTERLIQTSKATSSLISGKIYDNTAYTGADVFMGLAFKFGTPIESPANTSTVPMGDDGPGFLGRLYNKIFGSKKQGELKKY